MGKLFRERNEYSDDEYENEALENEEFAEETAEEDDWSDDEPEDGEAEDEDADDEDADEDEEDYEEDEETLRRADRRRRRIRNQVIAYSVVFVILASIVAGGVAAGRNVARIAKEKRLVKAQEEMQAQIQAEQEAEAVHDKVIAAPEPVEEELEADPLEEVVTSSISAMPLEDKVAGLFIVTPEALTGVGTATQAGEGTQEALNQWGIGGLIYFDKNIKDREQITEMLSSTVAKSKYPIFLAVDEEGGSVSRVANSGIDVIQVDDMAQIGENGDTAQAYETGLTIGNYLKELGFNLDFAPVADVTGEEKSAVGDRAFGSDPQLVGDMVANVVEGIEGTGVSSCLKHFPGIGAAKEDTHDGRVETEKTLDEMRSLDFIPFQAGIKAGADFVMVSHITVASEEAVPSSLSKTIMTDILRGELGFEGVIITDALNMSAITEYYTTEEAAVMALQGGADMLLMPEDFNKAYDAVLAAVEDGAITEERIDESLRRIYRVKYRDRIE
ncbi:MAG: beta-N-acetylhexosaminidase [Ruminococcus flavefaciens]|nr:beta-N-acetylhexosaminidase [Ruminococcus flavefaciens]